MLAALLTGCSARTPALEAVLDEYPKLRPGIYEELGRWERALGPAQTVLQTDEAETFFYWPRHGVAVFTHPLYEGQYRSKQREERKVTSVIVPLVKSVAPRFLPVERDVVIRFDRLLDLTVATDEPPRLGEPRGSDGCRHLDTVSSPWLRTTERLHVCDGQPVAVEIRDTWWLSHYD